MIHILPEQIWVWTVNCKLTPMIVGTGIDLIEVARIAQAIERYGERFLRRVFTPAEIRYCDSRRNRMERYAARFAAKEAASKALGTGLRRGVTWQTMEVRRELSGRPTLTFSGAAAEHAQRLGCKHISLSLTHTEQTAFAQVILED